MVVCPEPWFRVYVRESLGTPRAKPFVPGPLCGVLGVAKGVLKDSPWALSNSSRRSPSIVERRPAGLIRYICGGPFRALPHVATDVRAPLRVPDISSYEGRVSGLCQFGKFCLGIFQLLKVPGRTRSGLFHLV